MDRKYKVSFEVEGEYITDDLLLMKGNIEGAILQAFDVSTTDYYHKVYSQVSGLEVERVGKEE